MRLLIKGRTHIMKFDIVYRSIFMVHIPAADTGHLNFPGGLRKMHYCAAECAMAVQSHPRSIVVFGASCVTNPQQIEISGIRLFLITRDVQHANCTGWNNGTWCIQEI